VVIPAIAGSRGFEHLLNAASAGSRGFEHLLNAASAGVRAWRSRTYGRVNFHLLSTCFGPTPPALITDWQLGSGAVGAVS